MRTFRCFFGNDNHVTMRCHDNIPMSNMLRWLSDVLHRGPIRGLALCNSATIEAIDLPVSQCFPGQTEIEVTVVFTDHETRADISPFICTIPTSYTDPEDGLVTGTAKSEDTTCVICYDEGADVCLQVCKHRYHCACIQSYFERNETCPICRAKITDIDSD